MRLWGAYVAAKSTKTLTRILGREGTSLPGAVALRLHPRVLADIRKHLAHVILVTGTNGKTTTTRILADIARAAGHRVVTNTLGANLKQGITTTLLDNLPHLKGATGIIEVDEATLPKVIEALQPEAVVVTNFFRDQMDRYSELDHVVNKVLGALKQAPDATWILNADDPLVRSLGDHGQKPFYYGMKPGLIRAEGGPSVLDGQTCKRCGKRLEYSTYYYGHLGEYRCSCGFERPNPEVEVTELSIAPKGTRFMLKNGLAGEILSPAPYNAYNALAAMATARALGWSETAIEKAVARIKTEIGRMEYFTTPSGKRVVLTLVKNPTGLNEVLKVLQKVASQEEIDLMMVLNDLAADGRDISWIWDASQEILERDRIGTLLVSGLRAHDLAVRLKYAGLTGIEIETTPFNAADRMLKESERPLQILTTYTSLYALRDHLIARGLE